MSKRKMHLKQIDYYSGEWWISFLPACGMHPDGAPTTDRPDHVTCKNCLKIGTMKRWKEYHAEKATR